MEKIKILLHSKKLTIVLGIITVLFGIAFYFAYFAKLGPCYQAYSLTYVPFPYDFSEVKFNKVAEEKMNCSAEAVRFINGDSREWSLEERDIKEGLKIYHFDIAHMDFVENNGRKYAFVNDRNGNDALLGFIENTFIYITNEKEQKLSKEDMIGMFNGLTKK